MEIEETGTVLKNHDMAPPFPNNGSSDSTSSPESGSEDASAEPGETRLDTEKPKHSARTSFKRHQHVRTPKGLGRVVKVKGSEVCVELDSARIGETRTFDAEDLRSAEEVLREAPF